MNAALDSAPSMIDRIRHDLVGLKMPRALEALATWFAASSTENSPLWRRSTSCSPRS